MPSVPVGTQTLSRLLSQYNNYFPCLTEMCDKILIVEELEFTGEYILCRRDDTERLVPLMAYNKHEGLWICIYKEQLEKMLNNTNAPWRVW